MIFVPATATTLQLDLDGPRAYRQFRQALPWLAGRLRPVAMAISPSRTPGHQHVVIHLRRRLTPGLRVATQLVLGSDRVRERCNLSRLLRGSPYPIVFFERRHP